MSKDDVSLDDELLLVTEKKKAVVQKKSKDTSPKRDEDEGEASGSGGEDNSDHKSNKRKPKSEPKKPLKKRKTGESSGESSDDEVYDDGWDDDLMGDDEDRAKLNAMAMIEREAILDERYTKRKELREAWAVKRRLKLEQRDRDRKERRESKDTSRDSNKDRETRDRVVKKSDSKGKALSELKKKRAKAGYKKSDSEEEEGEVEETKGDDDDYEYEPKKKSASSDNHASKSSKSRDDDKPKEKIADRSNDDEITLQEIEKIRLNRETLEKWVDKPFFSSLIPGFFVRIGIGMDPASRMNVYRLAEIESVQIKTSYVLNGKQTNKWLKLMIGDKSKDFRMETISNRPVTESEYKHWKSIMEKAIRTIPTSVDVPKKVDTLAIAKDYRYTSDDIQKMLEEKKEAGSLPIKLGAEKARLAILRDTCINVHEKAELEKKIAEIDELVKERERKRVNTASVSNINQRNKQYNFITTLESKAEEKSGNSDTDPFSRRRTLPRITYASKHKVEEEPIVTTPPPSSPIPTNGTNGNTSAETSTNGNPLQGSTGVPEVKPNEHDTIDLDIPLTSSTPASRPFHSHLSSLSSASSLSSSSQPEKKKATLSLDDYMRRRKAME